MINEFTKGGQTFFQNFRMFCKIFKKLSSFFVIAWLVSFAMLMYLKTTPYQRYEMWILLQAKPMGFMFSKVGNELEAFGLHDFKNNPLNHGISFNTQGGYERLTYQEAVSEIATPQFKHSFKNILMLSAIESAFLALFMSILIAKILVKVGKRVSDKKILRGAKFLDQKDLKALIKRKTKKSFSDLTISGISLPKRFETNHIWINGVPGSGKTVAFCHLMSQIRSLKKRAVVYDTMGVYVGRFYRPGKDIILNPFDKRSPMWSPWAECKHSVDYEMIAASQISISPGGNEDPFWKKAARSLYSATLRRLAKEGMAKNITLLRYLLTADLEKLRALLKNTEAEALVSKDLEKTALSVKAILNDDIKSLRFLEDSGPLFSIRDWIRKDDDDSWIFITSRPDQHETLMPLISTWYDIAITEALSLPDNESRRIFFPLDELPTLKYLPALKRGVPLGRQKGLCFILGTQGFSQMNVNYGHEEAKSIIGSAGTKIILRSGEDAEKISQSFNQAETRERSESISYGVNDNRDGISISDRVNTQYVVLPSELQSLDNLHAYLKIPGNYPLTKIEFNYVDYSEHNNRFEPKDRDVDWLIEVENNTFFDDDLEKKSEEKLNKNMKFQKSSLNGELVREGHGSGGKNSASSRNCAEHEHLDSDRDPEGMDVGDDEIYKF